MDGLGSEADLLRESNPRLRLLTLVWESRVIMLCGTAWRDEQSHVHQQ